MRLLRDWWRVILLGAALIALLTLLPTWAKVYVNLALSFVFFMVGVHQFRRQPLWWMQFITSALFFVGMVTSSWLVRIENERVDILLEPEVQWPDADYIPAGEHPRIS